MSSTFIEVDHPTLRPGYVPPRGVIPVPPEVQEQVARVEQRFLAERGIAITPEARQRMLNEYTLDLYFRDMWISYRETDGVIEVLAIGPEETGALLQQLSQEEVLRVRTGAI